MDQYIRRIKKLILEQLKDEPVEVIFFGSRANATAPSGADVDIALNALKKLSPSIIARLKTILEDSDIPYKVDIIDLTRTNENFRKEVLKKGIFWKHIN